MLAFAGNDDVSTLIGKALHGKSVDADGAIDLKSPDLRRKVMRRGLRFLIFSMLLSALGALSLIHISEPTRPY